MSVPLRLDIRHYETIVAIIDHGSMTAAARQLAISQSAMSHRLGEAERRLGVALFARGADRRLSATRQGIAAYQAANRALAELSRLEDDLVGANPSVQTTIRIGVGSYEAFHWYPGFLLQLRASRPDLDLDLLAVGDHPGPTLADRTVDLILVPGEPSGEHELHTAFEDELVLVCAPGHPLAERESIVVVDLLDQTYLTYNALPSPGFEYDRFIRPAGDPPRIVRTVKQTSAIIELVAAGVGVSILSRWATAPIADAGRISTVSCGDGLPISWHVAHRPADGVAAEVAQLLISYLAD
jgi:LysR family transcriptional regulator for metE and metH